MLWFQTNNTNHSQCHYGNVGIEESTSGAHILTFHDGPHDQYSSQWTFYAGYSCELAADLIITATMVIMFAQKNVGMRRYVHQLLRRSSLFRIILQHTCSSDRFTQTLLVYFLNSGLLVM